MSGPLRWVKRLDPEPDESLASFLSRWARGNAQQSRPGLLQVIGVSKSIRIKTSDVEKLAAALVLDRTVLLNIAPSDLPGAPALRRGLTRPLDEAVCPRCLETASYSRQIWSHRLATACSAHGVRLVDRCGQCQKPISHDRPLAHLCRCGADLRRLPTVAATAAEVEFAGLLVGHLSPTTMFPFAINCDVPADVDLFFLGLANQFGGGPGGAPRPKAGKAEVPVSVDGVRARLEVAFDLLANWPHNFDARLQDLMELPSPLATTGVAKRLGTWYAFLFKRHTHPLFEPLATRLTSGGAWVAGKCSQATNCSKSRLEDAMSLPGVLDVDLQSGLSAVPTKAGLSQPSARRRCRPIVANGCQLDCPERGWPLPIEPPMPPESWIANQHQAGLRQRRANDRNQF